jgi:hypothetical protein
VKIAASYQEKTQRSRSGLTDQLGCCGVLPSQHTQQNKKVTYIINNLYLSTPSHGFPLLLLSLLLLPAALRERRQPCQPNHAALPALS